MPFRRYSESACAAGALLLASFIAAAGSAHRVQSGKDAPRTEADPAAKTAPGGNPEAVPVKLYVLAEGSGRKLVLDLKADDFEVLDDGQPQRVTSYAARSTEPLSLGILLETSRARLYEPEPVAWQAYSNMLRKLLGPGDQAFVATFAEKVTIRSPFTEDFRKLDDALHDAFTAPPQGTAALYDAIDNLCDEPFAGLRGRKALLVIADSADDSSFHTEVETLDRIQRAGLTVYFLLPWIERAYQPTFGAAQPAQFFANSTGGLFFVALGGKALLNDIDGIAAGLAYTYTLGYIPSTGLGDGRFHTVKVKCRRRGVKIHATEGYYAAAR